MSKLAEYKKKFVDLMKGLAVKHSVTIIAGNHLRAQTGTLAHFYRFTGTCGIISDVILSPIRFRW
ncbi:MAG: hypothetical protein ABIQ35_04365 [Verrucomicrobiota bacterium]